MFIKEQRVTKYQTEAVPQIRSEFPDFGLDPDFFSKAVRIRSGFYLKSLELTKLASKTGIFLQFSASWF